MTDIWYQNPKILLNDINQFIPNNKLSKINNINSIARFAIYLSIILLILKQDNRWLLIPILLLFISYYLNTTTNFLDSHIDKTSSLQSSIIYPKNIKSTIDNPYMNYITNNIITNNTNSFPPLLPKNITINSDIPTSLNLFIKDETKNTESNIPTNPLSQNITVKTPDINNSITPSDRIINNTIIKTDETIKDYTESTLINNSINYDLCITSNNNKSCSPNNKIIEEPYNLPNKFKIDANLKKEIRKNYRSHLKFDSIDMWGKLINDRNYYTTPNIDIVNDQTGFAEWCYTNNGESGNCKTYGSNCVKNRDIKYHRGRFYIDN